MTDDPPDSPDLALADEIAAASERAVVPTDDALKNIKGRSLLHPFGGPKFEALTDADIITENERLKLKQRKHIANVAGAMAITQVVCADVVFILYAQFGKHWDLPPAAIEAWLAATVVQVIGVVLVITQSLFPRGKSDDA